MKKRILSIAVSLCTVLSLFPVSAYAEEFHTPEPLYSNVGESVSGNESISGNQSVSGNSAQNTTSQENNILTAVEKVQALLNALPTAESLEGADDATVNAAYEAAQNVYDAIDELEAEEIALLTGMEKLSALMDWFNGQVTSMDVDPNKVALTYKASGFTDITTETFSTMNGALDKVKTLSGATEITITAGSSISELEDLSGTSNFTMPTGTYTIILNNDFSILFQVIIGDNTNVTIKSNTSKYSVSCNGITMNGGELSIDGLNLNSTAKLNIEIGTLNLKNSTFSCNEISIKGKLNLDNSSEIKNGTLNVIGGTVNLSGKLSCGVELQNDATLKVTGGTCTRSFLINSSKLIIENDSTMRESINLYSGSKATISGGTFEQEFFFSEVSDIELSGGTFKSLIQISGENPDKVLSDYLAPKCLFYKLSSNANILYSEVSNSKGLNNVGVRPCTSHVNDDSDNLCDYCNCDISMLVASITKSNVTQYYSDLAEAQSAATADSTVKLLKNVNLTDEFIVSKSFTLDLNNYTLKGSITVNSGSTESGSNNFTLTDSSTNQKGTLSGTVTVAGANATLNIQGGVINSVVVQSGGTLNCKGGTITSLTNNGVANHIGGTATCDWPARCSVCKKWYGEIDSSNHRLDHHFDKRTPTENAAGCIEYWQCGGCGKTFLDQYGKNPVKSEDIKRNLPKITDGTGQSLNAGENKELSFRSDADFYEFNRVDLDGKTVDPENYTKRKGSTIITLNAGYVASLPKGEHTISIVSEFGTASTTFTVLEASTPTNEPASTPANEPASTPTNEPASTPANEPVVTKAAEKTSPATGDGNNIALWITMLLLGGLCMGAGIYGKKSNNKTL